MLEGHITTPHHSICRDYWQLLMTVDEEPKKADYVMLSSRRRLTEPFWHPIVLPAAELPRLQKSLKDAAYYAESCRWNASLRSPPSYPHGDTVAICSGPFYTIELIECLDGNLKPSVSMTLLENITPARSALHLFDEEIEAFVSDLLEIEHAICRLHPSNAEAGEPNPHVLEFTGGNYGSPG